jgi:hypothetical protein
VGDCQIQSVNKRCDARNAYFSMRSAELGKALRHRRDAGRGVQFVLLTPCCCCCTALHRNAHLGLNSHHHDATHRHGSDWYGARRVYVRIHGASLRLSGKTCRPFATQTTGGEESRVSEYETDTALNTTAKCPYPEMLFPILRSICIHTPLPPGLSRLPRSDRFNSHYKNAASRPN